MPDRIRSNKKATASRGFTPLRIALAEKENMNMNELTLTRENFEEEVLQSELPVLVDFYADWCGPCKMMGPVVEKCAEAYAGKMKIGKLNVDDNMAIAQKYRVVSIPHFIVFKSGEPAVTFGGAMSEADFCRKLDQVLA